MAREKATYRDNLEELRSRFPGRELISVPDAARYLGVTKERLLGDPTFPICFLGQQRSVVLVNMARWLSA